MKQATVSIGSNSFRAEVADSILARAKGLSGRETLARGEAMLFPFAIPWKYSFWMKGMRFPIDIIWIRKSRVIDISENVSAPGSDDSLLNISRAKPKEAVDAVLEVVAGTVARGGIKAGDKVEIAESH